MSQVESKAVSPTQGDWVVSDEILNGDEMAVTSGSLVICGVWPQDEEVRHPQQVANARLIAASPDLLKAAEFVVDWLNSFCQPATTTKQECDEAHAVLSRAINRAKGQS